jgi:hypothetical protein
MKEGDIKTVTSVCKARMCDFVDGCEEKATLRHTFLLEDARHNPASRGYRGDDISWASDDEVFSCAAHEDQVRWHQVPYGMKWCSTFSIERFPHMFLYWENQ